MRDDETAHNVYLCQGRDVVESSYAYSADSGRLFQSKPATCSAAMRPPVPRDAGHVAGA